MGEGGDFVGTVTLAHLGLRGVQVKGAAIHDEDTVSSGACFL